jgi:hypothetical protein
MYFDCAKEEGATGWGGIIYGLGAQLTPTLTQDGSSRFNLNERAKARHGWKFEAGFYLLKVFDRLVPTVGAIQ